MSIEDAFEILERRMKDLGYKDDYYPDVVHLVLQPGEARERDAHNQLWILVDETSSIKVESDFGFYDLTARNVNELCYEFQGKIKVTNYTGGIINVRFVTGTPKHKNISNGSQHID
jgi:hypothetical protein